jgi:transposase
MMFGFGPATRIYVATGDPESGHVFLFTNARRNRLKLLVYDHSGTMDMLEKIGRRKVSLAGSRHVGHEDHTEPRGTGVVVGGIDLAETRRRKWYRKPLTEESEKLPIPA